MSEGSCDEASRSIKIPYSNLGLLEALKRLLGAFKLPRASKKSLCSFGVLCEKVVAPDILENSGLLHKPTSRQTVVPAVEGLQSTLQWGSHKIFFLFFLLVVPHQFAIQYCFFPVTPVSAVLVIQSISVEAGTLTKGCCLSVLSFLSCSPAVVLSSEHLLGKFIRRYEGQCKVATDLQLTSDCALHRVIEALKDALPHSRGHLGHLQRCSR